MLRRLSIVALFLFAWCSCAEASKLKGVVRSNELGGPPLRDVAVSAVAGANATVTDAFGTFTLEFPNKQPGETILLIVQKEGFEVVNDIQLELSLPTDADAKPVTILLCKVGNREEMARRFYRLKSLEAVEESYRTRLEELQQAQQGSSRAIAELKQERDEARTAAEKAAEELAKVKPGQTTELYRAAMRLFLDGKTEQALKVLDEEKLRGLLTSSKERKAEAEKEIEDATETWLLKARLLTVQFRFAEAEKAYRAAIEASPGSFEANFAFGAFNQELNRHKDALISYEHCLELARRNRRDGDIATTLNNLGVLHLQQNRMDEARKAFQEALQIRRTLAGKNADSYLPDVAATLNNLGVLHLQQNRMDEARKDYEEALQIRRTLAEKNPDSYLPDVTTTLNNLGVLHQTQNRMDEARKDYEEALQIQRALAEKNPETYLPHVAMTLNNLGILHKTQNRTDEARMAFAEALQIYQRFAAHNPEQFQAQVQTLQRLLRELPQ
jgi:tetratricopeptide (TPR) repeat protein